MLTCFTVMAGLHAFSSLSNLESIKMRTYQSALLTRLARRIGQVDLIEVGLTRGTLSIKHQVVSTNPEAEQKLHTL